MVLPQAQRYFHYFARDEYTKHHMKFHYGTTLRSCNWPNSAIFVSSWTNQLRAIFLLLNGRVLWRTVKASTETRGTHRNDLNQLSQTYHGRIAEPHKKQVCVLLFLLYKLVQERRRKSACSAVLTKLVTENRERTTPMSSRVKRPTTPMKNLFHWNAISHDL